MKKKILSCLLVLAMLLSTIVALPISAGAVEPDTTWASDTEATSYTIADEADLLAFSKAVSEGTTFAGKTINLTANITVSEGSTWYGTGNFSGTFDGKGYTISGIKFTATQIAGIFGGTGNDAKVCNVRIENSLITVTASTTLTVAGIFGRVTSGSTTIENVYADIDITYSTTDMDYGGGFLAAVWGGSVTISNCVYAGTIGASVNVEEMGGFIGTVNADATIENSVVTGTMTFGAKAARSGGFVGHERKDASGNELVIKNSGFFGTFTAKGGDSQGKFVGKLTGGDNNPFLSFENCIAAGTLTTTTGVQLVGAFLGQRTAGNSTASVKDSLYTAVTYGGTTSADNMIGQELEGKDEAWINDFTTNTNNKSKTAADLQGISAQSILPTGWVASTSATGNPVPATLVGLAPVNTVATPVTTVKGYQATEKESEKFSIRLVGVINGTDDVTDLADYDAVGFRVVAHYTDDTNGLQVKTNVVTTATVYSALGATTASGYTTYNATELGGLIFALNCNNIPANSGVITFEVTPIIEAGNVETEGSTVTFTVDPTDIPAADLTAA